MTWTEQSLGLANKYGEAARFAAATVLGAALPGGAAVLALADKALDAAQTAGGAAVAAGDADLQRLGEVFAVLDGELALLMAQVAALQGLDAVALQVLDTTFRADDKLQPALR